MGFDVSYHPIDLDLALNRIIPFVCGEGVLDDLIAHGMRITKIRLRAKEWAMGLLSHRFSNRPKQPPTGSAEELIDWLSIVENGFDEDLQVWSRPFLITALDAAGAVDCYERYLDCAPEDVDEIAREQLVELDPDDEVEPSNSVGDLGDPRLSWEVGWKMALFREAFAAHVRKQRVAITSDLRIEPAELFIAEFAMSLISFMSHLYPGWATRGQVWPSQLFVRAGMDAATRFQSCQEIFEPMLALFPDIAVQLGTTLGVSTRLGGYLTAADVPEALRQLQRQRSRLLVLAVTEGWGAHARQELAKIEEALLFCARNGLAFLEVSDLYSPTFGVTP